MKPVPSSHRQTVYATHPEEWASEHGFTSMPQRLHIPTKSKPEPRTAAITSTHKENPVKRTPSDAELDRIVANAVEKAVPTKRAVAPPSPKVEREPDLAALDKAVTTMSDMVRRKDFSGAVKLNDVIMMTANPAEKTAFEERRNKWFASLQESEQMQLMLSGEPE